MSDSVSKPPSESALFRLVAPAKPSRKRLVILWAILILWIAALVALYFTTIRPRHPSPPARGIAGDALAAPRLLAAH